MRDPDDARFKVLKETSPGMRLRLAMREMQIALKVLRRPSGQFSVEMFRTDEWRRAYIKASDNASIAISDLWHAFQWPHDAGYEPSYAFKPKDLPSGSADKSIGSPSPRPRRRS